MNIAVQQKGIAVNLYKPNSEEAKEFVLVLGFMGSNQKALVKKYQSLVENFNLNIVAITLPFRLMLSSKAFFREFDKAMDWFEDMQVLSKLKSLVICSSGGAFLNCQLNEWIDSRTDLEISFDRIMWENSPGECTLDEVYRGVLQMLPTKTDSLFKQIIIKPFLNLFYKINNGYAQKVIESRIQIPNHKDKKPHLTCIASLKDKVVYYEHLQNWAQKMQELGNEVDFQTVDDFGHLKAHKNAEKFNSIWKDFLMA